MSPRALLLTGFGTLLLGLLLVLTVNTDSGTASARGLLAQGYLANACVLIGSGLVLLAAVLGALRSMAPQPPARSIDHYS